MHIEITTVFLIASAVILIVLILPGTLYMLVLSVANMKKEPATGRDPDTSDPVGEELLIAIVIPAHNESRFIARAVASIRDSGSESSHFDIHVVADNCTDDTAELARQAGAFVIERSDPVRLGKGFALNYAFAELLKGETVYDAFIVVDADTEVENGFVSSFSRVFKGGADVAQCYYSMRPQSTGRRQLMRIAFVASTALRVRARQILGLSVGILGNGFGLSRRVLKNSDFEAFSIVEDLEYHLHLVRSGHRVELVSDTTIWSDFPDESESVVLQRARWEGGRFRMIMDHAPGLLKGVLQGKLNLLDPLLDLLLLPLSYHLVLTVLLLIYPFATSLVVALFSIATLTLLISIAMKLGNDVRTDLKALLTAPWYIVWKLCLLPRVLLNARRDAKWSHVDETN